MDDLHRRVNAGIRATGGDNFGWMIRNMGDGRFNSSLNAVGMHLGLPTGKDAAVVFDAEGDARHG
jgi:hypothetical protein